MITLEYIDANDIFSLMWSQNLKLVCEGTTNKIITDTFLINEIVAHSHDSGHFYIELNKVSNEMMYRIYISEDFK